MLKILRLKLSEAWPTYGIQITYCFSSDSVFDFSPICFFDTNLLTQRSNTSFGYPFLINMSVNLVISEWNNDHVLHTVYALLRKHVINPNFHCDGQNADIFKITSVFVAFRYTSVVCPNFSFPFSAVFVSKSARVFGPISQVKCRFG